MRFIRTLRFFLIFALLLGSVARAEGYKVLVVGDSISAAYGISEQDGWVALAEKQLQKDGFDVTFTNASISGDTTGGGLRRLPDALERFNPDLLIIELGGNDGLRGYPTNAMQNNLEAMASLAKDFGTDVLIQGMMIPSNYGAAYLKLFAKAFETAAANTNSLFLPFLLQPIAEDRNYFQSDGIHPTADAQPLLMLHTLPLIKSAIEKATINAQ